MVYHGRTLTTKVSLRDACAAIAKYAFVASPYPIIISAEIHCSVPQQEMIASIMREEFGSALVSAPINGRPKVVVLPSPEDLKGRILLKVGSFRPHPIAVSEAPLYGMYRPRICTSRRTIACRRRRLASTRSRRPLKRLHRNQISRARSDRNGARFARARLR